MRIVQRPRVGGGYDPTDKKLLSIDSIVLPVSVVLSLPLILPAVKFSLTASVEIYAFILFFIIGIA